MVKVLIIGSNSYIGKAVKNYLDSETDYDVNSISVRNISIVPDMFIGYKVVIDVIGIAHIKETVENRQIYHAVNYTLTVDIANAAKKAGVQQFILLSSMSVYGLTVGRITKNTVPHPNTVYGKSKFQADEEIKKLENETFKFVCIRPPMVYGENCKGNYQRLRKFALKFPVFPSYANKRSMIYIGNLVEFVRTTIQFERSGLFFPQNAEYVNTARMVELIAYNHNKNIRLTKAFNWVIRIIPSKVVKKVFGDLIYEPVDTVDKYGFEESIRLAEQK